LALLFAKFKGFRIALRGWLDQSVSWCGIPIHLTS